jgi:maleate isomerase
MNPAALGLIVPPSNPTLEVEIRELLGEARSLFVSRLPYCQAPDLNVRNSVYREACLETALRFGTLPLRGIAVGCTGVFYPLGPEQDRRFCEAMSRQLGVPCLSASLASLDLIQRFGFRRIQLVLPYPDWLITQAVAYFRAAGLEVVGVHSLLGILAETHPYAVEVGDLEAWLQQLQVPPDTLVFLSGTGLHSNGALAGLLRLSNLPLLSANVAITAWLLNRHEPPGRGSQLLREVIAHVEGLSPRHCDHRPDRLFNPY